MPDKYIIFRKTHRGKFESDFCPFVYFAGVAGPDKTCCWCADITKALVYDSYEEAQKVALPYPNRHEWGVDLHPESRYEQT